MTTDHARRNQSHDPGQAAEHPLTASDAARIAGVHERTIRRAIARGELAATRRNGRFGIEPDALQVYLKRTHTTGPTTRRSAQARRQPKLSSLPAPPTAIIGREQEVRQALALLAGPDGRLLTLTGPGGVGKTRLALAVAIAGAPALADGAVYIPLEAVREPEQVVTSIAQSLGVAPAEGRPLRESLAEAVRHRRLLLVLDNFEHLLAAATVVADLLAAGPGLRLLVTSREALRLRGETEIVVPPLVVPDLLGQPTADRIGRASAVELFVRRARAARPDFVLTDANAASVGAICQQLDGLPLAIELAAAQIKHTSPATLHTRLERRLDALAEGPRDLPDRLRTMRAAIGWSYDLLDPGEQAIFRALSVFAGGFTPEAVAAISGLQAPGTDPEVAAPQVRAGARSGADIHQALLSLVDKSLLSQQQPAGDAPRFTMLETIREFASEQLAASGEQHVIRSRHAAYVLSLAEAASADFHGPAEAPALTRLESELGNFRAALDWASREPGSIELALRLANGLFWLWYVRGYHPEGWGWFGALLARPDAEQAPAPLANAMIHAGWLALRTGRSEQAETLFATALGRCLALGLARSTAFARGSCGFARLVGFGDAGRAATLLEEARAEAQAAGDGWLEAMDTYGLGIAALATGDMAAAQVHCERSLTVSREHGDAQGVAASLAVLGQLARLRGEEVTATRIFAEALTNYRLVGDRGNVCTCVESLAGLLVVIGRPEQGVLLLGAATALRQRIGTPVPGHEQARYDADLAAAQAALSEEAFRAAWQTGAEMSLQEVISGLALEAPATHASASISAGGSTAPALTHLTQRERQVLELVSAGYTDRQIGNLLSISPATVTKHVGNVLGKLGVHSRTAAAILLLTASI